MLVASAALVGGADAREAGLVAAEAVPHDAHLVFKSKRDGDEDVYAADPDGRRVAALTRNGSLDDDVVVSKNGRWLALERQYSTLVLLSGDGRRERKLGSGTPVEFSPDGRLLAFSRENPDTEVMRVFVVAVAGGRPRPLGRGQPVAFSPNGRLLVFRDPYVERLGVLDLVTGRRWLVRGSDYDDFVGWSPDSARIAFVRDDEDDRLNRTATLLVADTRRAKLAAKALVRGESIIAE